MQKAIIEAGPGRAGWTATRRAAFLATIEDCGDVSVACCACRLSRQSAYKLRRRDAAFARGWDAALRRRHGRQDAELAAVVAELGRRADEREAFSRTPSTYQPGVNQPLAKYLGEPLRSLRLTVAPHELSARDSMGTNERLSRSSGAGF